MKFGIDKIGFATSHLYVDMSELAVARNEEPGKYLVGLGQSKMAVIPPSQDAVTLACSAADKILTDADKGEIGLVIFGTETGIDNSKAAAMYLVDLLGLPQNIRAFEVKQACYGATAGIAIARDYLRAHPDKKALVLGADIARYGLKTSGEPTQGGGAIALLLAASPQIMSLEEEPVYRAQNIMDFWRPLGLSEARVQGKYSSDVYLEYFERLFAEYCQQNESTLNDFAALVFHLPYTKMGLKALRTVLDEVSPEKAEYYLQQFEAAREFNRNVGNLYTGSLYLSLLSLLQNSSRLSVGDKVGLFSYGSGAQGEFFTGILQPGFAEIASDQGTAQFLAARHKVSVAEYEDLYQASLQNGADLQVDFENDPAKFVFTGVKNHQRQYLKRES
ncbi:hydroxymethylglutaryl-CoA synthase [Ligilactobacillus salitolerans]|uniref:Hydroxymethylglutaryl-CoA synthase n=1 Tax=Ligilactobacillus salitolerans TaxID=1808352 RepID=A0A401IVK1_9LACO|nr:hydroxymethylglutaryl-CoA synthase [Ligilactobacillus salitolerans]GBG95583.1 hydroxymethylglutaryl-CoA synthase [Ligilactobacillus salitolerans]